MSDEILHVWVALDKGLPWDGPRDPAEIYSSRHLSHEHFSHLQFGMTLPG